MSFDVTTVLVGVVVSVLTEVLKKLKGVPINPGQTALIRSTSALLSIVAVIFTRWTQGGLDDPSFVNNASQVIVDSLTVYLSSALTYFSVLRKP